MKEKKEKQGDKEMKKFQIIITIETKDLGDFDPNREDNFPITQKVIEEDFEYVAPEVPGYVTSINQHVKEVQLTDDELWPEVAKDRDDCLKKGICIHCRKAVDKAKMDIGHREIYEDSAVCTDCFEGN